MARCSWKELVCSGQWWREFISNRIQLFAGNSATSSIDCSEKGTNMYVTTGTCLFAYHSFSTQGHQWFSRADVLLRTAKKILGEFCRRTTSEMCLFDRSRAVCNITTVSWHIVTVICSRRSCSSMNEIRPSRGIWLSVITMIFVGYSTRISIPIFDYARIWWIIWTSSSRSSKQSSHPWINLERTPWHRQVNADCIRWSCASKIPVFSTITSWKSSFNFMKVPEMFSLSPRLIARCRFAGQ